MNWNEETLAYAAGFLDGEGCFFVGRNDKITITCSNTNKAVIDWFKETFGGSSCSTPGRKTGHRTMFMWQVVSLDALKLLSSIITYLKVKQEQAVGLMLMQATMTKGGKPIRPEIRKERDIISLRVKEAKRATA